MTQAEQVQTLERSKEDTQRVTGQSNDMDTRIGGASVGDQGKQVGKQTRYSLWKTDIFSKPKEKSVNLSVNVSFRYECNFKCRCKVKRGSD